MMYDPAEIAPDLGTVSSVDDVDLSLSSELRDALSEARSFLTFFEWGNITSEFLGAHFDGIFSIFLFGIEPGRDDVDHWVWVFVGDIPPAYITCEDAKSPYEALDGYIGAMEEWVQAARDGASVADMIPVNVPATPEYAAALESRLKFLDEEILPLLK
ncbi:hypothetical protein [Sphingomonas sp. LM7]|uniref:hypothetical protein n=1 Tax=Sphingomonas sp. LM7 TaxID=1938607 RepID=UPI001C0B85B6|nr:hypothetical protein [Sphingomonas sp. LM7]